MLSRWSTYEIRVDFRPRMLTCLEKNKFNFPHSNQKTLSIYRELKRDD